MTAKSSTAVAERREALRRQRMAAPGAKERAAKLSEASRRVEPGFVGALAVLTGKSAADLRRRGF